ncbi:DUF2254 domain-containing protein [Blastococcus sp. MG754426]|uniref:DUF2254 domain-containing protein n=1 Tax=unclassified Blastococcus TaxID=2619396 RepID=UPI001EF02F41|nr:MULTISPECIES: DUF2254 domain-containing protein [unclassified Blastococcus]MCF6507410.1 DUF2254 domain-containing protein [Blastococcus sp. MG754426]MCF6512042.1 DUF2254 domain-containing protein [Blastococcus sp. MG754427]
MHEIHPVRRLWRSMRSALWPIPLLTLVLAVALGIGMPVVDRLLGTGGPGSPLGFVFGGGPAAARDLLSAIAGSLISVTGVIFSLTVVALQLGSSQYSPRLLQTFATDRVVQYTLAQLTGTFVYALTVLRTVRTAEAAAGDDSFVPRVSITLAFLFALGSVVALVVFLGHLARSLRVETMLRDVHAEATLAVRDEEEPEDTPVRPEGRATQLEATRSGFVVRVDAQRLVRAARDAGVVLALSPRTGDAVVAGTPLAEAWRREGGVDGDPGALRDAVNEGVTLSYERSPEQDPAYSLRKIVDIAGRALSPGINDPTTAVHALSHVSALLGDLLPRRSSLRAWRDEDGVVRLLVPRWTAEELLSLGLEEPLQYASGQPAVLRRIAGLLHELAWRVRGEGFDSSLRALLDRTVDQALESTSIGSRETDAWRAAVEEALAGRWSPARRLSPRSPAGEAG